MWRNCARLLIGFVVLIGSGCFIMWAGFGWKYVWHKQSAIAAKQHSAPLIDPTFAKDPSIDAARLKVIGPLANAITEQPENTSADPNDAAANAALDSSSAEATDERRPADPAIPFNLVGHVEASGPQHWHTTFRLKTYRYFRLYVPPHATSPRLQGTFAAYSAESKNAESADFLVLDDNQLHDFVHQGGGDAIFSHESSRGVIDLQLSPTILDAKDYYLVFSSPDRRPRIVVADLMATFD